MEVMKMGPKITEKISSTTRIIAAPAKTLFVSVDMLLVEFSTSTAFTSLFVEMFG